jgi:hypothetical protein
MPKPPRGDTLYSLPLAAERRNSVDAGVSRWTWKSRASSAYGGAMGFGTQPPADAGG